jgi:hypothetical protein
MQNVNQEQSSAELNAELVSAQMQHRTALRSIEEAQARFDETGADGDAQGILDAQQAADRVQLRVERLERLVARATEREQQERLHAQAEAVRRAKAAFQDAMAEDERLEDEEAQLLLKVVDLRTRRWAVRTNALEQLRPYGGPGSEVSNWHREPRPSYRRVSKALEAAMVQDPRSPMIRALVPESEHYNLHDPRGNVKPGALKPFVEEAPKEPGKVVGFFSRLTGSDRASA